MSNAAIPNEVEIIYMYVHLGCNFFDIFSIARTHPIPKLNAPIVPNTTNSALNIHSPIPILCTSQSIPLPLFQLIVVIVQIGDLLLVFKLDAQYVIFGSKAANFVL